MRDGVSSAPKPMAMIGERPLMWHVMRYYAHFGHTDFVLCLGYGASYVKDFFLNYDETRSNDFVLEGGDARQPKLFRTDISDWRITFVDTGLHSSIGERLRRVRRFVEDEEMFLANYADVFTDAPLPDLIARFEASNAVASLLAVPLAVLAPRGGRRRRRADHEGDAGPGAAPVGERRLLRDAAGDLRLPERGRGPGRGRAPAADRAGPGAGLPATRATGRPPTRSRSGPSWRRCTTAGTARGCSGTRSGRAPLARPTWCSGRPWPTRRRKVEPP